MPSASKRAAVRMSIEAARLRTFADHDTGLDRLRARGEPGDRVRIRRVDIPCLRGELVERHDVCRADRGSFGRGAWRRIRLRSKGFEVPVEHRVHGVEHRKLRDGRAHVRTERVLAHRYTERGDAVTPIVEHRYSRQRLTG